MPKAQEPPFAVALTSCQGYANAQNAVHEVLLASKIIGESGSGFLSCNDKILIKPNLLRAHNLSCTQPEIMYALCLCLKEYGVNISVADSPGFGFAHSVAQSVGMSELLKPLGIKVQSFEKSTPVPIGNNKNWQIARLALECDKIISVPRLKTHSQMRLTLAVKNLFGCICGMHKPLAHAIQGRSIEEFSCAILNLWQALPPTAAVIDGVTCMHIAGPSSGEPFELNLVGASSCALALDTAIYEMLKVDSAKVPLWKNAKKLNINAAFSENLTYPIKNPEDFNVNNFIIPENLNELSFLPHRFLLSLWKRFLSRF